MGILKSTLGLSFATLLSRVLGFLRDVLFASIIGGGLVMSAWTFASLIPNMFRRLLGEGALGTALVPIIAHTLEHEGTSGARKKFSTVVIWLFFLLTLITVVFSAGALILLPFCHEVRWRITLLTVPVIMPYCILICLVGVFTSVLNTIRLFFWPAMASLLPNLLLIACAVLLLPPLLEDPVELLRVCSFTILISGVLELAALGFLLARRHMLPGIGKAALLNFSAVREVWWKVLPGLLGAAAFQVGTLTDGLLAMSINDYAKSAMYYSDRLVYLPIGLFAVAFGTVSLPTLSKHAAEGRVKTMLAECFASMRQLLFITIPLAAGMIFFSKELLSICFMRGNFSERALDEANLAMFWYSFGIPSFALIKLTLNTFYCRKSMKIPAVTSVVCIVLNICLSILLMFPMRQGGIALASVVTGTLNNVILLVILRRELGRMPLAGTLKFAGIVTAVSAVCGFAARKVFDLAGGIPALEILPKHLIPLTVAGIVFLGLFIGLCAVFRLHELKLVFAALKRKFGRVRS